MVVKCDACNAVGATLRCSACKTAVYCDSKCAKRDWKAGHNELCKAWVDQMKRIEGMDVKIDSLMAKLDRMEQDQETCCICLESKLSIEDSYFLPCRHFLCGRCIYKLPAKHTVITNEHGETVGIEKIENANCPLCRAKLPDQNAWLQYLYQSACELIQRANRLPEGCEARVKLCSYARSQSRLITKWFTDTIAEKGTSENMKSNYERMSKLLDILEVEIRLCEGNAEGCLQKAQELLSSGKYDDSNNRRVDLLIKVGESHMQLRDFEKATKLGFLEAFKLADQSMSRASRTIFHQLTQCFYELGDYAKALECGNAAVQMNRHFSGLYKYIAPTHKAMGNIEQAIDTMNDALVYESPWEQLGKEDNKLLLDQLKEEQQRKEG